MPACVARGDLLYVGNFAPFYEILHIKGRNFPDVFYPFKSTYDLCEPCKVSWKLVRTFFRNPEHRHTRTDAATLYIYRYRHSFVHASLQRAQLYCTASMRCSESHMCNAELSSTDFHTTNVVDANRQTCLHFTRERKRLLVSCIYVFLIKRQAHPYCPRRQL